MTPSAAAPNGRRSGGRILCAAGCVALAMLLARPESARAGDPVRTESRTDDDSIRQELDEILAKPQFRRVHSQRKAPASEPSEFRFPEWLEKFFESLSEFFDRLGRFFSGMNGALSAMGILYQLLAYLTLAVICGLIVYLVVRVIRATRQGTRAEKTPTHVVGEEFAPAPGERPADAYLRSAAELAAQGNYQAAIGQLVLGGMSYTERQGLIRFRQGLTYRDYLRALAGRKPPREAFQLLVRTYEPICFGRRPASSEQYETVVAGYLEGFQNA